MVAKVDENRRPIPGTEMVFDCDTILLSVGLIPENELTSGAGITLDPRTKGPVVFENMETSAPGVFACGNVVHVHDLVDFVTAESQRAGAAAARYALGQASDGPAVEITNGEGVGYTVPQKVRPAAVDKAGDLLPGAPGVRQFGGGGHQRGCAAGPVQAGASGPRRDGTHHPARGPAGKGGGRAGSGGEEEQA